MSSPRFYLSLFLVTCLFPAGCRKHSGGTKLIDGLESHQTVDQVRSRVLVTPKEWKIIENSRLNPADKRPRFHILTVSVQNYIHLDVAGQLILHFFNDRLASTVFFPDDFPKYKANLEQRENIKFDKLYIYIPPRTKMWVGKDSKGQDCIGWEDSALREAIDRWIKDYS